VETVVILPRPIYVRWRHPKRGIQQKTKFGGKNKISKTKRDEQLTLFSV